MRNHFDRTQVNGREKTPTCSNHFTLINDNSNQLLVATVHARRYLRQWTRKEEKKKTESLNRICSTSVRPPFVHQFRLSPSKNFKSATLGGGVPQHYPHVCVCVIVCGEKCNCESTLNSPPPYTIHSGCALWETLTSVEAEKRKSNQQDLAVVAAGSNAGEGTGRKYKKPTKNSAAERKQRERESKCLKSRMHGKRLL